MRNIVLLLTLISSSAIAQTDVAVGPYPDGIEINGVWYEAKGEFKTTINHHWKIAQRNGKDEIGVHYVPQALNMVFDPAGASWINYADDDDFLQEDLIITERGTVRTVQRSYSAGGTHFVALDRVFYIDHGEYVRRLQVGEPQSYTVTSTLN